MRSSSCLLLQEAIKSGLMGIGIHLQATDQGELELEYIKSQVQKV